ncbi:MULTISPECIES: polysaccharide lyase 6 family protein [Streptomyces]|uniref:Polysaccharide lyase 6 family protein n=1 Tax=Streptomyces sudanensis TaxID=436397 RepID=A0ABY4TIC4_9ACTN|nr:MULTISPECIES: polysaccharide lyase 6 family protein [Streptomyces]URN18502.1 polysaccharide lyase 6 family protein [Streptomyces sudanensis]
MTTTSSADDGGTSAAAAAGRTVTVDSAEALLKALGKAAPGDRVELAPGNYDWGKPVVLQAAGTKEAPITIASARRGGAVFDGAASFAFGRAEHLVIQGFQFRQRTMLTVANTARHIRITRNLFEFDESGDKNTWLFVAADDTRVDRNAFRNKSSQGVFLQIDGPGDTVARRVRVDRNLFHEHRFGGSNGGEAIRLGYGVKGPAVANAVIEGNLFLAASGDDEVVSVKCSGNVVRNNTITGGTRGSIVLRSGDNSTVSGNFLLGTAGIRIYGDDHEVFNNHLQGEGQLVIGPGDRGGEHRPARRALVVHNTVVATGGQAALRVKSGDVPPSSVTVAGNILVSDGKAVQVPAAKDFTWRGNVVTESRGDLPASGGVQADPRLKADGTGVLRLTSASLKVPGLARVPDSFPQARTDINGRPRPEAGNAGAEQFEATPTVTRAPLTTDEVGPSSK